MKAKEMKKMAIRIVVGVIVSVMAFGFLAPAFANAEEIGGVDFERKCAIKKEHSMTCVYEKEATDRTPGFEIHMCTYCGISRKVYTTERLSKEWNDEYRNLSPSEEVDQYNGNQETSFAQKQAKLEEMYNNGETISILTEGVNLEDVLPSILAEYGIYENDNVTEEEAEVEEPETTEVETTVVEEMPTEPAEVEKPVAQETQTEPAKVEKPVAQEVENPNPNTGNAPIMFGGVAVVSLGLIIVLACAVIAHRRESK